MNASRAWMLRMAALLGVGALAVHQLRYLLGYGGHASDALAATGHAYLGSAGALVAGICALGLAEAMSRAARGHSITVPGMRVVWAGATAALCCIYSVQELVEGTSPIQHGGWLAAPLAAVVAFAIALLMRGTRSASSVASRPWTSPPPLARTVAPSLALPLQKRDGSPRLVTARGPPLASV